MSKPAAISLAIVTCLPYLLFGVYFYWFFNAILASVNNPFVQDEAPKVFLGNMMGMMLLMGLMMLVSLGLMIFYIVHAVNDKNMDSSERVMWVLLFVFAGFVGFPVYWYLRIWRYAKSTE